MHISVGKIVVATNITGELSYSASIYWILAIMNSFNKFQLIALFTYIFSAYHSKSYLDLLRTCIPGFWGVRCYYHFLFVGLWCHRYFCNWPEIIIYFRQLFYYIRAVFLYYISGNLYFRFFFALCALPATTLVAFFKWPLPDRCFLFFWLSRRQSLP